MAVIVAGVALVAVAGSSSVAAGAWLRRRRSRGGLRTEDEQSDSGRARG